MAEIGRVLVDQAKQGDPKAISELLNRILGRPVEADLIENLKALESAFNVARPATLAGGDRQ
jgi:hypothetical protein